MEANASLRGLVNRNTGEGLLGLCETEAGTRKVALIHRTAPRVRNKFDRKRPKKMSNQEVGKSR